MALLAAIAALSGCQGTPIGEETTARRQVTAVGSEYRPKERSLALPVLIERSPASDYLRFAILRHPQVEAAYQDWRASVEAITPARSLPDPQIVLQPDVTSSNTLAIMPGVMFDFMTRGKRAAMGREMAAGSDAAYRKYAATVFQIAAAVRKAWIELAYVDAALNLRHQALDAERQALAVANAGYETGSGMTTLESQVALLNQTGEIESKVAALEDRRAATRSRFKAALGLGPEETDPPWPHFELQATALPSEADLWTAAIRVNPELGEMRAMVEMAVADVEMARQSKVPDFSAGIMYDSMASPVPVRPAASVTLPIWRDKIAAAVAGAEAKRAAAVARLDAERIGLAAEIAQMLYMVHESDRMIAYIDRTALPNLDRSIASTAAAYQSGMGTPAMIPGARLMALDMRLERLDTLREREIAVTDLLLMLAAVVPPDAPLLPGTSGTSP